MLVPSRRQERAEAPLTAPDLVPDLAGGAEEVDRSADGRSPVTAAAGSGAGRSGAARPLCDAVRTSA
jgi:hypothetical protein